jgi:isocitrate lyase
VTLSGICNIACRQGLSAGNFTIHSLLGDTPSTMFRSAGRALRQQRRSLYKPRSMRSAIRPLSYGATNMTGSLTPVEPPLPSPQATDAFQLLSTKEKASAEDDIFNAQVQQVKEWWASPRYEGIKRPYSAETVVSKRGALQQVYPSSLMARKLFNLLEERAKEGKPVHTSMYIYSINKHCNNRLHFCSQWVPLILFR